MSESDPNGRTLFKLQGGQHVVYYWLNPVSAICAT